jgi:hypothetical protein
MKGNSGRFGVQHASSTGRMDEIGGANILLRR